MKNVIIGLLEMIGFAVVVGSALFVTQVIKHF